MWYTFLPFFSKISMAGQCFRRTTESDFGSAPQWPRHNGPQCEALFGVLDRELKHNDLGNRGGRKKIISSSNIRGLQIGPRDAVKNEMTHAEKCLLTCSASTVVAQNWARVCQQ